MRLRRIFHSFRFRLIAATLVLMMSGIMLSSLLNTRYFVAYLQHQNEQRAAESFDIVEEQLKKMLYEAQTAAYRMADIDEVHDYLVSPPADKVLETVARRNFARTVDESIRNYSFLDSVIFMRTDGTIAGSSAQRRYFYGGRAHPFFDTDEYREVAGSNDYVWIGYYSRGYFTTSATDTELAGNHLVWGARNIHYTFSTGRAPLNVLALFAVSEGALQEVITYAQDTDSTLHLLDRNGRKLAGDAGLTAGTVPDYFAAFTGNDFFSLEYTAQNGTDYQVVYRHLERTGWYLVKVTPLHVFRDSVRPFWVFALVVGLIALLAVFLLYTLWIQWLTRPLLEMSDALRKVAENDRNVRILNRGHESDEIAMMKEQFNRMLDSIDMLLRQRQADQEEKLRLEMRSLQAQIAPHFIYNTIASIRWMATMSGADQVAEMLVTLVNLLRPVFRSWTTQWTVREELSYMENYIKMMQMRYGNGITFHMENRLSQDGLLPRFILQPLLENCFVHGITGEDPLSITIAFEEDNGDMVIRIRDNGVGIPPDKLAAMQSLLQSPPRPEQGGESIGLTNVDRRIKLFSGSQYGISIQSRPGMGTCVTVRLRRKTAG